MKASLKLLIATYRDMLSHTRSKIRRECLENVIADLEAILEGAQ